MNRQAIARYGLQAEGVAEAIEASFGGATVDRIIDRGTPFDLIVKFDPAASSAFERIADLPVDTPAGQPVPVRLLADVRREEGANMILRENVQRRIVASANVSTQKPPNSQDKAGFLCEFREFCVDRRGSSSRSSR